MPANPSIRLALCVGLLSIAVVVVVPGSASAGSTAPACTWVWQRGPSITEYSINDVAVGPHALWAAATDVRFSERSKPGVVRFQAGKWTTPRVQTPGIGSDARGVVAGFGGPWVVGSWRTNAHELMPLVERWKSNRFTIIRFPFGRGGGALTAAQAGPDGWFTAGWSRAADGTKRTLLAEWRDGHWQRVRIPGTSRAVPVAMSVGDDGTVWLITERGVTLEFDGTTWTRHRIRSGEFSASAFAPDGPWAVGTSLDQDILSQTSAYRWDGSGWIETPTPTTNGEFTWVTAGPDALAWAGGFADANGGPQTPPLVEHWTAHSWVRLYHPRLPSYVGHRGMQLFVGVTYRGALWTIGTADLNGRLVVGRITC